MSQELLMSCEDEAVCLLLSPREQMLRISMARTPETATLLAMESTETVNRCLTLIGASERLPFGGQISNN